MTRLCSSLLGLFCVALLLVTGGGVARAQIAPPGPKNGSSGLQGTVQTPAPKVAATIIIPRNGQSFSTMPITVSGTCPNGLLVKIFANNVFVGSAMCTNGSYSLQVDIFDGRNDLVARVFDSLDQPGPDSNIVTVTFNNDQFKTTGVPLLSLTSPYARRGANPGEELPWPIIISGGTAPYAVSVDWGDGKGQTLYSEPFAGTFTIAHTYQSAGIFIIIIKATDKAGQTAYLQLVGQANGNAAQSSSGSKVGPSVIIRTIVIWIPAALAIPLLFFAFWLGRRYQITVLRRNLERRKED